MKLDMTKYDAFNRPIFYFITKSGERLSQKSCLKIGQNFCDRYHLNFGQTGFKGGPEINDPKYFLSILTETDIIFLIRQYPMTVASYSVLAGEENIKAVKEILSEAKPGETTWQILENARQQEIRENEKPDNN